MGQIPLGNFDEVRVSNPVQTGTPDLSGSLQAGRAGQQLGETMVNLAERGMQVHQQRQAQEAQEDEALARAKAANALTRHELQVRSLALDVSNRAQTGTLDYNHAGEAYDEEASKIEVEEIPNLPPDLAEHYRGGIANNALGARLTVDSAARQAKRDDGKAQFFTSLDELNKLAGLPGADISAINAKAAAFIPLARAAGLDEAVVSKAVQDFADRNWLTQVQQRRIGANEDINALRQLEADLTDEKGMYADKLDADKRTTAWSAIQGDIDRLETRASTLTDKREAKAERLLNERNAAEATGIPLSVDKEIEIREAVRGTSYEERYIASLARSSELRQVRAAPFAEQERYIADLEAKVRNTPSDDPKRELERINALRSALEANRKLAAENPLQLVQNMTGQPIEPLDLQGLASGNADIATAQLKGRYDILAAFRAKYGREVTLNPWRPEEAGMVRQAFAAVPGDAQKLVLLGALVESAPNADAAKATLAPLADDPVLMQAGQEQYLKHRSARGASVAELLMQGQRVIKDKAVDLPGDDALQKAFDAAVGDALPVGSPARTEAFLRFRLLYAGTASAAGQGKADPKGINRDTADTALSLATGGIIEHGDARTIKPWGWSDEKFKDAVRPAAVAALSNQPDYMGPAVHGYSADELASRPLQAIGGQPGAYFVLDGTRLLLNPRTGKPYILRLQ